MLYTDSELSSSLGNHWNVHPGSDMSTSPGCWAFCTGGWCLSDLGSTCVTKLDPSGPSKAPFIHVSLSLSFVYRTRQLRFFSLQKGRLQGHLFAAFEYLKGACKKDGDQHFSRACGDRTWPNGFGVAGGWFRLLCADPCRAVLSHAQPGCACRAGRLRGLWRTHSPLRTLSTPAHA